MDGDRDVLLGSAELVGDLLVQRLRDNRSQTSILLTDGLRGNLPASMIRVRSIHPSPVNPAFRNHLPVKIRFGDGWSADLAAVLADEGAPPPTGRHRRGPRRPGTRGGRRARRRPRRRDVREGARRADGRASSSGRPRRCASSGCDAVAAIGGGSAIDTAKAARLVAGQGGPYMRFARGEAVYEAPRTPAGLRSDDRRAPAAEVSGGAVITDERTHVKAGIASPHLRAQHALVDPALTYGLPPKITAHTGIDALAQAIAGMVVTVRTPIGDGIALESIRLAGGALVPRSSRDGSDRRGSRTDGVRESDGGPGMNISDCGSEHSLGQAIGGRFGLPHGLTIGLVLAETMDRDRAARARPVRTDRRCAGRARRRSRRRVARRHRRPPDPGQLEFPTLAAVGVTDDTSTGSPRGALADYFISVAPAPWSAEEVRAAYAQGLALGASRIATHGRPTVSADRDPPGALLHWESLPGHVQILDRRSRRRGAALLLHITLFRQPIAFRASLRRLLGHPRHLSRGDRVSQRGARRRRELDGDEPPTTPTTDRDPGIRLPSRAR